MQNRFAMAPIKNVLLVFAMEAEATPLIEHLGLRKDNACRFAGPAPCVTFSGTVGELSVHLVWNGKCSDHNVDLVGTVPASLSTYLATMTFDPDLIISAGTAGGFKSMGAAIGDTFVSKEIVNHDRRIPIPGFDKYGVGHVECPPTPNMQADLGFKLGVVSSGNSLDYTDKCMDMMGQHKVAVKEMEAAAIAWVAGLFGKPMLCVKSITDIVDGGRPSQEEFLENLGTAAKSLQAAVPKVLAFVTGKELGQL